MKLLKLLERLKCKSQLKVRTANKVLPKAGVTNFYETFVLNRTLVFQMNSSAETLRLRQYPKPLYLNSLMPIIPPKESLGQLLTGRIP